MQIDTLDKYAKYFGLGTKTGVELRDETSGVLASKETKVKMHPDASYWAPGDTLNAAIGQGDNEFSPLQMAKYISMLANGGNKIDVSIIKTIRNADGTEESRDNINKFVKQKLGLSDDDSEKLKYKSGKLESCVRGYEVCYRRGNSGKYI